MPVPEPGTRFRNVFILDSRAWFASCRDRFDPATDFVLTYDLALKREIEGMGGRASYADHLVNSEAMQENNFLAYEFFRQWHFNAEGRDIFTYAGVPFGASLVVYFWNEYICYVRARLCLEKLRDWSFDTAFVGTRLGMAEKILGEMDVAYSPVAADVSSNLPDYYFPIHAWLAENIERRGFKARVSGPLSWALGTLLSWVDRIRWQRNLMPAIFAQLYHPTIKLIERLKQDAKVRVVGTTVSRNFLRTLASSRYIPILGNAARFEPAAEDCMRRLRAERCARLVLTNGLDISAGAYESIERHISGRCAEVIRTLDCAIRYLDGNPIRLEVMISSGGVPNGLIDSVCRIRGVPSYMIINGLMSGDFLDESKCATVINSYGTSIKENYFRGMDNVVCLGDPRMDAYPPCERPRLFNKDSFAVTIGASGYNSIDLNSYLAVEFEFMFDVLQALSIVKKEGVKLRIVIKVRPNGYLTQYQEFASEYFPGLVDEILDKTPMKEVLEKSDFYISIYSQTVFEASCLGIPCLYYKNDVEVLDPPFDEKSELVTVRSVEGLVQAIEDFRSGSGRFDAFLQRAVMEKYIGPLDGRNLERNLEFIYEMLRRHENGDVNWNAVVADQPR